MVIVEVEVFQGQYENKKQQNIINIIHIGDGVMVPGGVIGVALAAVVQTLLAKRREPMLR